MNTIKWFALIFKPAPLGCERKLSPLLSPGLGRLFLPTNETERFPFHLRRAPRVRGWEGRKTSWRLGAGAHSQPVSKPMRKQCLYVVVTHYIFGLKYFMCVLVTSRTFSSSGLGNWLAEPSKWVSVTPSPAPNNMSSSFGGSGVASESENKEACVWNFAVIVRR